ncbi:hypothetical protein [Roseateles noduli]|uniref:hypothetical protein n=1 Tax=Roseateles noduli TaxID=2052484 RepID=UPI003D64E508
MLARVEHQIDRCINTTRFHETLVSKWNVWRGKASGYKTLRGLRNGLQRELAATVGPMGENSWDAVFLRAVLADPEALAWMHTNPIQTSAVRRYRGVAR